MTEREMMLRRISSIDFAIVELHLYLDTHPNSEDVKRKLSEYEEKSRELVSEYEKKYGSIVSGQTSGNGWDWISNPWPWDNDEGAE